MIIRRDEPQNDQGTENRAERFGAFESRRYSQLGGLTQFGAYVETLEPRSRSAERHWHEQEDEMIYLISGEATVIENDGAHVLHPGDAACWPAGVANGHHIENRSQAPCTYLIVGTRAPRDVVHYPDLGQVLYNEGEKWRLVRADGTVVRSGGYSYESGTTFDGPK